MPARLPKSNKVTKAGENLPLGTNILALAPGRYFVDSVGSSDWAGMNLPVLTWHYEIVVYASENMVGLLYNYKVITVYPDGAHDIYVNRMNYNGDWTGWRKNATAMPPTEYDLPLASGMSSVGRSVYRKNQFNEVFLSFDVNGNIPYGQLIATLPVGYRPAATQYIPCFCGVDWTSGFVSIENDGSIKAHFSATQHNAISQTSFVAMN